MIYLGGDQIGSTLDFNPFSIVHEKHREMGIINDDRPRVLSQSTPRTKSTPARSMTRRSTEKEWVWRMTRMFSQIFVQLRRTPFPTMTARGVVTWEVRPRKRTTRAWMKLWVLPPSIKTTTSWPCIEPNTRKVSGAVWPNKACKLIWAEKGSGASAELLELRLSRDGMVLGTWSREISL